MTQTFTTFFSMLSVSLFFVTLALIVFKVVDMFRGVRSPFWDILYNNVGVVFTVSGTAMAGSLYYSEIVGYPPCTLCWYQRICIYSIAIISLVALIRRKPAEFRSYALTFAIIGIPISLYHTWLQAFPRPTSFCTTDAPCAERHVWEFGFVSIPFMALTVVFFVATFVITTRKNKNQKELEIN